VNAAHYFCNNGNFVIVQDIVDILGELVGIGKSGEIPDIKNVLEVKINVGFLVDLLLVFQEKLNCARANNAVSENCKFSHNINSLKILYCSYDGRILFFTEEVILHRRGHSSRKRLLFTEEVTLPI